MQPIPLPLSWSLAGRDLHWHLALGRVSANAHFVVLDISVEEQGLQGPCTWTHGKLALYICYGMSLGAYARVPPMCSRRAIILFVGSCLHWLKSVGAWIPLLFSWAIGWGLLALSTSRHGRGACTATMLMTRLPQRWVPDPTCCNFSTMLPSGRAPTALSGRIFATWILLGTVSLPPRLICLTPRS